MTDVRRDRDLEELDFPFLTISGAKEAHEKCKEAFTKALANIESMRDDGYDTEQNKNITDSLRNTSQALFALEDHVRKNHKSMKP